MAFPSSELILNPDGSIYHLRLLPEDLADTVILVGDPDRVALVSRHFDTIDVRKQHREFVTHTGTIGRKRMSVVSSGIGSDNVEIVMTELDALRHIDLQQRVPRTEKRPLNLIRIGTSGSLQEDIPVDSVVASRRAVGLDGLLDFYATDESRWQPDLAASLKTTLGLRLQPYVAEASPVLFESFHDVVSSVPGFTLTCPGFYAPQGRHLRLAPKIDGVIGKLQAFRYEGWRLTNFEMETAAYYLFGALLGHEMLSLNAIVANRATGEFSARPEQTIEKLIRDTLCWASDL